ncbi:MAG: hypothetical protein HY237_02700, partial [Acidobacteria bacterium]|nr:hypothetical protein [Acidobacteriota bacterium]
LRRTRFDQLRDAYESLFDAASKLADFGKVRSEKDFILQLLLRLAIGLAAGIFEGSSSYEAVALLNRHEQLVRRCLDDVAETVSALLDWTRVYTKLHRWEDAVPLLNRAIDLQREKAGEDVQNTFRLISAIVDSPDIELLRRAKSLLPECMRVASDDSQLRTTIAPKVLHVYTDYLWRLDGPAAAIEVLKKYVQPEGNIKPDGLLYMRLGQLHESAGTNWNEAKEAYKHAAELDQAPETALNCKHRYAVFLSRHRLPDAPDPDFLFEETLTYATDHGLEREPARVAWAQHKMTSAWRAKFDDLRARHIRDAKHMLDHALASYRARYIVEAHAWLLLVALITDWEEYLPGDRQSHREQAEKLCREITENEFIPWRARLMANHILGRLVGLSSAYSFKGRLRPNPGESLLILRRSFESMGKQRSDPHRKTFQDALAHRAIKDVYEQVLKKTRPDARDPAKRRERIWLEREEFHGRCAFEGLARADAPLPG